MMQPNQKTQQSQPTARASMSSAVRLNKHLAHSLGISRREADNRIEQGRVKINGKTASLGNIIDPSRDVLSQDDQPISSTAVNYTYLLMNKPIGYVCSRRKQGDSPTIYELLPPQYHQLKVAGRLDKDSCGLLLLTDDGDTIFQLTHPKFNKQKVYHAQLSKALASADIAAIEAGLTLEDGVSTFQIDPLQRERTYKITMHEGRNRQIRRTFKELNYIVTHLERISFGKYQLSDLADQLYLLVK